MSKDRKKLLHIHSSVNDKQPTPATLELGELGVNNAKGNAFISTKNSDGEVVRFSEDETIIGWMEQKEVFPYEGYMRGADNSQVDGVTEQDLLDNKSNLIIKLNQVVPENTDYSPYDEKVNGAKDIYGNLINPISAGSYKDGAGLAIDMSKYAMIGANPSFSSITTTCHATLNGTTEIKGKGDGCGSKFTVEVANACIDASDTLNEYGVNHSNFGTSCDGTKVSNDTTLKGKKIFIDSPSGNLTVDIQACNHISGRTNDFVIRECQDNGGKVEIDTTDIDVSASTTDVKSCDRISAITNDFQVKECAANGKAGISSTTINNSASTIDEKACTRISESTNQFNITECTDGQGTTTIKSCKKFNVKSNDILLEQCGNSGKTHIHSCAGITLESKNITLTDGNCGSGQTTIEVNDLCLVGERKINVYGDETNVGLDCDDSKIATNARVFGKGTLITTKATPTTYAGENNIETVAAQDIKENADRDINETAGRNINEKAPTITESGSTISGYATTQIVEKAPQIIESASTSISNTAPTLNYSGNTTNISGNTLVNINANGNGGDVAVHAKDDITVHADDLLCESGKTVTIFAGEGGKLTIGGNSCDGNNRGTYPITYVRRPKTGTCDIHATTVDDALDEVYDRSRISLTSTAHTDSSTGSNYSYTEYTLHQDTGTCDVAIPFTVKETIVAMSAETYPATSELLKKYTLWQYIGNERKEIGEINIPKDHILKDVSIVNGHLNGSTFTPCPDGDTTCSWYIKLVWNVFDPSTGHADDKITYLPADDFVQDYEFHDSLAIDFTQWYDGQKNHVSADTTIRIMSNDGQTERKYGKANAVHTLSAYTLNSVSGDVKTANAATNWTYDPFDKKVTITAATDVNHLNRNRLKFVYGDVCSGPAQSYDPGAGTVNTTADTRITEVTIPRNLSNLGYTKLNIQYGATSGEPTQGFDPGSTTDTCTVGTETITIPSSVSHLNRGKFTVKHCNQEVIFDPSTDTSITMSHSTLSYTHNGFTGIYDPCTGGTFTAPHSSLTINYGVTCSSSEAVNKTYDTSAAKTIVIPKTISDITGGAIKLNECSGNCITVTGDICASGVVKATALYSTSDRNLKENINGISYDDYHKVSNVGLKSFNFKDDETKKKTYGVIAQDLQGVGLENIIHKDEQGNLSVDYTSFLILKIADLEHTIHELSNEIKNLKGENKNN